MATKNVKNLVPVDLKSLEKNGELLKKKLHLLLKDPSIENIRREFDIPPVGSIKWLGVTDPATPQEEELNKKNWHKEFSLTFDDKYLKSLGITVKSRATEFQSKVSKLRISYDLPDRFQQTLECFVRYNIFSSISSHPCLIKFIGKGQNRKACIEFDIDATQQDIVYAWRECRRQFKSMGFLAGGWLNRYDNFLLAKLVHSLHEQGVKDILIWHKVKEQTGTDFPKLKDEEYVKSLRQKHREFFLRIKKQGIS
jgi:hypothetical protein